MPLFRRKENFERFEKSDRNLITRRSVHSNFYLRALIINTYPEYSSHFSNKSYPSSKQINERANNPCNRLILPSSLGESLSFTLPSFHDRSCVPKITNFNLTGAWRGVTFMTALGSQSFHLYFPSSSASPPLPSVYFRDEVSAANTNVLRSCLLVLATGRKRKPVWCSVASIPVYRGCGRGDWIIRHDYTADPVDEGGPDNSLTEGGGGGVAVIFAKDAR